MIWGSIWVVTGIIRSERPIWIVWPGMGYSLRKPMLRRLPAVPQGAVYLLAFIHIRTDKSDSLIRDFPCESGISNLPSILSDHGYYTGVIGKIHVEPESELHFDYKRTKSLRDMQAISSMAEEFIMEQDEKPLFLMINYFDPHKSWHGYGDALQVNGHPEESAYRK